MLFFNHRYSLNDIYLVKSGVSLQIISIYFYSIDKATWADWIDTLLLVLCGGIPWQVGASRV